jgi:hypothetical protein
LTPIHWTWRSLEGQRITASCGEAEAFGSVVAQLELIMSVSNRQAMIGL